MRKQKIKYVSVKLPACNKAYPLDNFGCIKLPNYTTEYLTLRAKKLADILHTKVPGFLCSEVIKLLKEKEANR